MTRFLYWLTARLRCRIISGPNGEPYLERYYLFHLFGFTAYIHRFVDNDPDRGLHDHPWNWSCSLVLAGHYHELRGTRVARNLPVEHRLRFLKPGRINIIRGDTYHRILLHWNRTNRQKLEAWTLFIHRPHRKGWGFVQPSIRPDRHSGILWPEGAVPVYTPYTLDRHSQHEGWRRNAPKGRDVKERAPFRRAP